MDRAERILSAVETWAYAAGGLRLFCRRTAREIVDRCEGAGVRILGIDGMYLGPGATHSPIDLVYHPPESKRTDYDGARRYLDGTAHLPLFYELVLDDPGDGPGDADG